MVDSRPCRCGIVARSQVMRAQLRSGSGLRGGDYPAGVVRVQEV